MPAQPMNAPSVRLSILSAVAAGIAVSAIGTAPVEAGPVICTTTLEAPLVTTGDPATDPSGPVEVTRCDVTRTTPELIRRRFYSWTSPYARGVDITHQITDLFGIAMGGGDGTKVMGFGFADKTIIWDGTAIENTTRMLLEDQSDPLPLRTQDLPGVFDASLGASAVAEPAAAQDSNLTQTVRGLW